MIPHISFTPLSSTSHWVVSFIPLYSEAWKPQRPPHLPNFAGRFDCTALPHTFVCLNGVTVIWKMVQELLLVSTWLFLCEQLCESVNRQPLSALCDSAFGCPQDTKSVNALHSCKYERLLSGWTKGQMGCSQSSLFSMRQTCVLDRAARHW